MNGYQPLELSSLCNSSRAEASRRQASPSGGSFPGGKPLLEAPVGSQSFRGLPFLVGKPEPGPDDACFIELTAGDAPVTIPVGQPAPKIIVAHRLLESELMRGGKMGELVAHYVFHMEGGLRIVAPIRERFELVYLPNEWGMGFPFLALPNVKDELMPRYEGPWELAGLRQTGTGEDYPISYYLWCWNNPHPDRRIEYIELVPKGPRFLVAGITLGLLDEHPFPRQGTREVELTLTARETADEKFDIEVAVDRGEATYPQPLPRDPADRFIDDPLKGWGERPNRQASPTYVEVSATPSATVNVSQNGREVGSFNWGELEDKGAVASGAMQVRLLDRGRNWVRTRVLDDDTGQPVPCRVHFRSPEGVPYQPHGHHNHLNSGLDTWHFDNGGDVKLGQITYACIDGTCQGWLPRGEVIVDVARGFEYDPLRTNVHIEPGQQELVLRIKRWTNMNRQRWFSGDSHVHFLSPQGSHRESQAEDLNVVNLLQSQWGALFTNTEDFTGSPSISQSGDNIVYVSQENRQHMLGHTILWGLKEPIMPWCSDGPVEAELSGTMQTALSYWADQAHEQGGTVILPHFPSPNGEPAALIATGRIDGVEMIHHMEYNHIEYYRYLNCGYRIPLLGGTDKMSSDVAVGMYRTYAYVPDDQEFTYDNWRHSVAAGRTFATGGPMINITVDGRSIGDTLEMSSPGAVEVEAWAESIFPIHTLEIVRNGQVVASTENPQGARRLELKEKIVIDGHSWLAARCGGPNYYESTLHHDAWTRGVFAHTSPVYLACGGEWAMYDEDVAQYMLTLIDGSLTYMQEIARHYQPGTVTHHHSEDDHMAYLQRPLLQAREAVQSRLDSGR